MKRILSILILLIGLIVSVSAKDYVAPTRQSVEYTDSTTTDTYTINNKGEVEGAVYSPIYHSTVTETSDVVWDLAYSIFKNLVTKEDGSWAIDQISS